MELEKKAQELEQTLQAQLNALKGDSGDWIRVGSGVLAGGIVAFGLVRLLKGKKNKKTKQVMAVLEREGLLDKEISAKLTAKKEAGFMARMAAIVLPMAIAYGRKKFLDNYLNNTSDIEEE
ncbi:hypothetical protein ACFOUP_08295 [Belliella kenyensis]|uniref:Uncharacterized protein n=1 Tax=Belliella kenyensis TaxID=1472724 RepID=A0ABV8EMM1_9BACT|nr:hypothetical protein [Belliella kenyensis]MCH7403315.1 hypothetical protein [Belliella kenyensis]MDN3602956.1 hypothetical protein [Belliella kenyensis]